MTHRRIHYFGSDSADPRHFGLIGEPSFMVPSAGAIIGGFVGVSGVGRIDVPGT